jgi:EmrB/QacA subfamily drug resistance transporter
MCFALFMIMLDNTVVNVALPSIQADLDASLGGLQWTVNAYTLTFAVLLVTAGRLGDIFGRRRMFLFGVVVFALASATIGFAPGAGWLVAARSIQGFGAAFMMPGTLSIIVSAFPAAERARAIGIWAGVSSIALAVGPVIGGWLTEAVSWRAIFLVNLPVAAAAVAVTLFAARESRDETVTRRVDVPGIAGLTVALTALVLALIKGNAWGWGSQRTLGLLAVSVAAFLAFVAIERRAAAPVVDFRTLGSRQFVAANVAAFVVTFGMLAVFFFLALYLQNIVGYSPLETGLRFLPMTLLIACGGPVSGRLAARYGPRPPLVAGVLLIGAGLAWLSRLQVGSTYELLLPAFLLLGLGLGLAMSPMSIAAMAAVEPAKAGLASGTLAMVRMVGATFGVAVLGALIATLGRHDLERALPRLPDAARERLVDGLGSGAGLEQAPPGVADAANRAFVDALAAGMTICAAAMAIAALVAWCCITPAPARRRTPPARAVPEPA